MASNSSLTLTRNPYLVSAENGQPEFNQGDTRRWAWRNLYKLNRYGLTLRSENVLQLYKRFEDRIGKMPELRRLTSTTMFSGMVVVQKDKILFERYAPDFGPDMPHSIQSITKTTLNLIYGRLVAEGKVDLDATVETYLSDIGSGYRGVTVQDVLDMNVTNNYEEDYLAPYRKPTKASDLTGYRRGDVGLGWQLPPVGEDDFSMRSFLKEILSDDTGNPGNFMQYKSANSDVAGWIAEVAGGRDLKDWLADITNAAGLEHAFHISMDRDYFPILSGGGSLTARDLARYGLIFGRGGRGVNGEMIGNSDFIEATRKSGGTILEDTDGQHRYHNQIFTGGECLSHGGYAGQMLMTNPDKEAAISFFSVLENEDGDEDHYLPEVVAMMDQVMTSLPVVQS
ncbi:MAG: serine hydrolase [Sulfitobacter sp.]